MGPGDDERLRAYEQGFHRAGLPLFIADRSAATDIFNKFGLEETIDGDGFVSVYQNFNQTQAITASLKYSF